MIIGKYPCCGEQLCFYLPDVIPSLMRENCPNCGKKVFHILSNVEPKSFIEKEFFEKYVLDEENKTFDERSNL